MNTYIVGEYSIESACARWTIVRFSFELASSTASASLQSHKSRARARGYFVHSILLFSFIDLIGGGSVEGFCFWRNSSYWRLPIIVIPGTNRIGAVLFVILLHGWRVVKKKKTLNFGCLQRQTPITGSVDRRKLVHGVALIALFAASYQPLVFHALWAVCILVRPIRIVTRVTGVLVGGFSVYANSGAK